MKKGFSAITVLSLSFLFIIGTGCQDSGTFAVAGKTGTLGYGGELIVGLGSDIDVRAGINKLDFDVDEIDIEDIEYDFKANFDTMSGLLDWHIFDDSFHLTGGFYSMNNEITLDGRPTKSVDIGDISYTPNQIGSLKGKAEVDGLSPYLGIGWGNPMRSNRRWGFTLDLGVIFTDSPDVTLSSYGGTYSSDPTFLAELEKERQKIEDDLDVIQFYPVASLGLFIRF